MYLLDGSGYQPSTAEELKNELIADLEKYNADFLNYPQSFQGALLDQATVFLMYLELLISDLFNQFSYSQAQGTLLDLLGDDRGIRRKGVYKSEVTLRFTGTKGYVIPKGLAVTMSNDPSSGDKPVFYTYEETLINTTTGVVDVLAYSDATSIPQVAIGELDKIVDNIPSLSVENIDTPTEPREQESESEYRLRVQQRLRNPKAGSIGAVLGEISNIEGVDTRLVGWRKGELSSGGKTYKTFEIVVGGGDPVDIAYAIFRYGGINSFLYQSNPSGGESARTISQDIKVYNQTDTYKFTRPKKLSLAIKVKVPLRDVESDNASIQALTKDSMADYINSVPVGVLINIASLTEAFMTGFKKAKGTALNINGKQIDFEITANSSPLTVDGNGYFPIQFDEYLVLDSYDVEINA